MDNEAKKAKKLDSDGAECGHETYRDFFHIDDKTFYAEYCPECKSCWPVNEG